MTRKTLAKTPMIIDDSLEAARVTVDDAAMVARMDPRPTPDALERVRRLERSTQRIVQRLGMIRLA